MIKPQDDLISVQSNRGDSLGSTVRTSGVGSQSQSGLDIWGPLQRRKYLVALFCLVGALLGYVMYLKTPKVFSSSTKLMVTTQAPPIRIDGNVYSDKVSLSKHASLITSETVLEKAIYVGSFSTLQTFQESLNPVGDLKEMIRVFEETDETMQVVCTGPKPEDLTTILNQVVEAYRKIIVADSQSISEQTTALVEKLASKLANEKEDAESQWLKLRKQLGVSSTDDNGNLSNPYNKTMADLLVQQSAFANELRDVQDRANALAKSLKVDGETRVINPVLIQVAALDAQEYLNLKRGEFREEQVRSRIVNLDSDLRKRALLEQRLWSIEAKITELRFEQAKRSNVFGPGHKEIVAIDEQMAVFQRQRKELDTEIDELNQYIAEKSPDEAEADDIRESENLKLNEETFREQERRKWITMYQLKLENEQARLVGRLDGVKNELEIVTKNAETMAMGIVELNMLQRQIDKKDFEVNSILKQLSEMNILANNYTMTKVRTLDEPKYGMKIAPSLPKSLALGTILGFLLGLGLAILVDQSELSFRSPHEILEKINIPVVGRIPRINTRKVNPVKGNPALIVAHSPAATASEAFRDIRTGLFFRTSLDGTKTILFTSPSPGDGKSTVIANMAISIAQSGKRVVLVDADFRRPRVDQYFEEDISPGLLDVLSGEIDLKDSIRKTSPTRESILNHNRRSSSKSW